MKKVCWKVKRKQLPKQPCRQSSLPCCVAQRFCAPFWAVFWHTWLPICCRRRNARQEGICRDAMRVQPMQRQQQWHHRFGRTHHKLLPQKVCLDKPTSGHNFEATGIWRLLWMHKVAKKSTNRERYHVETQRASLRARSRATQAGNCQHNGTAHFVRFGGRNRCACNQLDFFLKHAKTAPRGGMFANNKQVESCWIFVENSNKSNCKFAVKNQESLWPLLQKSKQNSWLFSTKELYWMHQYWGIAKR